MIFITPAMPPQGVRHYSGIMVVNKVSWIFDSSTVGPIENGSMRMHISRTSCRKRGVFQPAAFVCGCMFLFIGSRKKHSDQWIIQVLVKGGRDCITLLEGNIYLENQWYVLQIGSNWLIICYLPTFPRSRIIH